ncbi:MAG: DUF533 domain-containing protein [Gammaproteobacteria bacterium]|jgi:uncharacterized protein (DUF697 family)/tellurite resistance protein|nr:DUF533 domain-containing protein [Gammaproteobacteria bacterium]
MDTSTQRAILNIMIHTALVDGQKSENERAAIRDVAESLAGQAGGAALAGVYQDVLLKRVTLSQAIAGLRELEHRQLAYEMAVCVCDADGVQSQAEQVFLASLREALRLADDDPAIASAVQADSIAAAAVAAPVATAAFSAAPTRDAELDKSILNYSILNGALELLPQSWASMAIIPLQVRMVYKIGKAHGVEMDQGHIKEFIATVGVGLTSQYVEQIGRKLIGGLVGKAAGKMLGGLTGAATGMAFSFATTYALGQVAKRYYAGGRVMSTELLKRTFQETLGSAKNLQQEYLPAIRQRASTLSASEVVELVRR